MFFHFYDRLESNLSQAVLFPNFMWTTFYRTHLLDPCQFSTYSWQEKMTPQDEIRSLFVERPLIQTDLPLEGPPLRFSMEIPVGLPLKGIRHSMRSGVWTFFRRSDEAQRRSCSTRHRSFVFLVFLWLILIVERRRADVEPTKIFVRY